MRAKKYPLFSRQILDFVLRLKFDLSSYAYQVEHLLNN